MLHFARTGRVEAGRHRLSGTGTAPPAGPRGSTRRTRSDSKGSTASSLRPKIATTASARRSSKGLGRVGGRNGRALRARACDVKEGRTPWCRAVSTVALRRLRIPNVCCASSVTLSREPSESRPRIRRLGFSRGSEKRSRGAWCGASHFRARASSVRSSARQRSAPLSRARFRGGFVRASEEHTSLAREVSRRIRSRVRGAHLSRADSSPSRPFLGISQKCPCVRVSHARAHRHDVSPPRALASRTARSAATPSTRATRRFSSARADAAAAAMRKHKHRKQRSARRVAASATLLAIDEATSIDTRAPRPRASPPSPPSRPSRATTRPLARFSASCPAPP